jgi:hypothetical protein
MRHPRVIPAALCLALLAACGGDSTNNSGDGSIHILVSQSAFQFDADGFDVRIDQGSPQPMPDNGELIINGVAPGDHTVQLSDVDLPCQVTNENPRTVTVSAGEPVTASFAVTCVSTGFIGVTTHTTGEDPDPDGYALQVDGANAPLIGANETVTLAVDAGDHAVTLSEIADNCAVQDGEDTKTVTVTAGNTTELTFEVVCTAVP